MNVELSQNRVAITLEENERFYVRGRLVRGIKAFNWVFPPPFPFGSPFIRLIHGTYFGLRELSGTGHREPYVITGLSHRGNFHVLHLKPGEKVYVNGSNLAGFSATLCSLRTHIRFQPPFWFLRKHFFPVFEGPGSILLYSRSKFEVTNRLTFQPERIVAFNIARPFRVSAPEPTTRSSQVFNLFSDEIIWEFLEPGETVAEIYNPDHSEDDEGNALWRAFKHLLGFLKF